eukprot:458445_1
MTASDTQFAFIITVTYVSIYGMIFLVTSAVCAYKIRQIRKKKKKSQSISTDKTTVNPPNSEEKATEDETKELKNFNYKTINDEDNTIKIANEEKWYTLIKDWFSLLLEKKKVYLALVPHIGDQATDFGVIYQYYSLWQTEDNALDDTGSANPKNFFYASVFVILIHRIISTVAIYNLTRKWTDILLQIFDLMMVKAIWVNYKLNKKDKANPQRFLEILEATFESGPQLLISTTYILKASTSDSQQITPLIIISVLSSLWSITSRVTADDKVLFGHLNKKKAELWTDLGFKYNKCPCIHWRYVWRVILWRFLEITNRVFICILLWVNLGGLALSVILVFEFIYLLVSAIKSRAVDPLSSLMYLSMNICTDSTISIKLFVGFFMYRMTSNLIYLILVTIFAVTRFETTKVEEYEIRNDITIESGFGLFMLIYAWITICIWPWAGLYVLFKGDEGGSNPGTNRTFRDLIQSNSFDDVVELLEFGMVPMTKKDVIKTEKRESSAYWINKSIKKIGVSVNTLIILKYIIAIAPETIDSEHYSYPLELECKNGGGLIHLCVILTQIQDEYDRNIIHNSSEILEEIIEYQNIDINSVNNNGQTALHLIAETDLFS